MASKQRKTNRINCSKEILDLARKMVFEEGKSKRKVAELLGMPESSLRKRLKREDVATSLGRFRPTFTLDVEKELVDHIKTLDAMFYGITLKKLRSVVYEYAEKNNIVHQFNKETKMAGKHWVRDFMRRNPDIAVRQPTSTSIARAMGFNKPQVDRFYDQLENIQKKHNFQPCQIYNMDESGFSTVPNKAPKVVSVKGKRCVNKISSAERGINVTVVCAMSASGNYIPPAFIFPRKHMKAELLDGAPANSIGLVTESGRMNTDLFLDWLNHFKYHAKPTETCPVLLVLDNYLAHTSLAAVNFCRKNFIHVITIPPHSTHKMQPLDRCFFSPLKKYFASECEKWMINHPGRPITIYQIATLFNAAYMRIANISNAVEGFKVGGICPFNRDLFSDVDFLASMVTERLEEHASNISIAEQNDTTEGVLNVATTSQAMIPRTSTSMPLPEEHTQNTAVTEKVASFHSPSSTPLGEKQIHTDEPTCSFMDIAPLPKASFARKASNRSKRSEIITDSPYKRKLEEETEASKKKIPRIICKTSQKPPSKPKKPPKNKKKMWRCPGCQENYKEPIVEDWIQCSLCTEWWHDKCTSYIGIGIYKCDLCV